MAYPVGVRVATDESGVDFQLLVRGYNQLFSISREALQDHFDAGGADLSEAMLSAFRNHFDVISRAAAEKHGIPSNGVIVLATHDFG